MSSTTKTVVIFLLQPEILVMENFKGDLCQDIRLQQQNQYLNLPYSEDIYNEDFI